MAVTDGAALWKRRYMDAVTTADRKFKELASELTSSVVLNEQLTLALEAAAQHEALLEKQVTAADEAAETARASMSHYASQSDATKRELAAAHDRADRTARQLTDAMQLNTQLQTDLASTVAELGFAHTQDAAVKQRERDHLASLEQAQQDGVRTAEMLLSVESRMTALLTRNAELDEELTRARAHSEHAKACMHESQLELREQLDRMAELTGAWSHSEQRLTQQVSEAQQQAASMTHQMKTAAQVHASQLHVLTQQCHDLKMWGEELQTHLEADASAAEARTKDAVRQATSEAMHRARMELSDLTSQREADNATMQNTLKEIRSAATQQVALYKEHLDGEYDRRLASEVAAACAACTRESDGQITQLQAQLAATVAERDGYHVELALVRAELEECHSVVLRLREEASALRRAGTAELRDAIATAVARCGSQHAADVQLRLDEAHMQWVVQQREQQATGRATHEAQLLATVERLNAEAAVTLRRAVNETRETCWNAGSARLEALQLQLDESTAARQLWSDRCQAMEMHLAESTQGASQLRDAVSVALAERDSAAAALSQCTSQHAEMVAQLQTELRHAHSALDAAAVLAESATNAAQSAITQMACAMDAAAAGFTDGINVLEGKLKRSVDSHSQALEQLQRATDELAVARQQCSTLEQASAASEADVTHLTARILQLGTDGNTAKLAWQVAEQELNANLTRSEATLTELTVTHVQLQQQASDLLASLHTVQQELAEMRAGIVEKDSRLSRVQESLDSAIAQIARLEEEVSQERTSGADERQQRIAAESRVVELARQLSQEQEQLHNAGMLLAQCRDELQAAERSAVARQDEHTAALAASHAEITTLNHAAVQTTAQLLSASRQVQLLKAQLQCAMDAGKIQHQIHAANVLAASRCAHEAACMAREDTISWGREYTDAIVAGLVALGHHDVREAMTQSNREGGMFLSPKEVLLLCLAVAADPRTGTVAVRTNDTPGISTPIHSQPPLLSSQLQLLTNFTSSTASAGGTTAMPTGRLVAVDHDHYGDGGDGNGSVVEGRGDISLTSPSAATILSHFLSPFSPNSHASWTPHHHSRTPSWEHHNGTTSPDDDYNQMRLVSSGAFTSPLLPQPLLAHDSPSPDGGETGASGDISFTVSPTPRKLTSSGRFNRDGAKHASALAPRHTPLDRSLKFYQSPVAAQPQSSLLVTSPPPPRSTHRHHHDAPVALTGAARNEVCERDRPVFPSHSGSHDSHPLDSGSTAAASPCTRSSSSESMLSVDAIGSPRPDLSAGSASTTRPLFVRGAVCDQLRRACVVHAAAVTLWTFANLCLGTGVRGDGGPTHTTSSLLPVAIGNAQAKVHAANERLARLHSFPIVTTGGVGGVASASTVSTATGTGTGTLVGAAVAAVQAAVGAVRKALDAAIEGGALTPSFVHHLYTMPIGYVSATAVGSGEVGVFLSALHHLLTRKEELRATPAWRVVCGGLAVASKLLAAAQDTSLLIGE